MGLEQSEILASFLNGVIAMGHVSVGFFFLRFWKRTTDRLFLLFAIAFWMLGVIRIAMVLMGQPGEEHYLYWFRFAAYLVILAAIIDKNLKK